VDRPEFNFDPSTALDTYRSVFAPTLHAQIEGLEWGVAQARANLTLGTPAETIKQSP
jgi:hypothetical protein